MDLPLEELQFFSISEIMREATLIPKRAPRTFYLITLILIFPLSFAILAHSLFTHPLLAQLDRMTPEGLADSKLARHDWTVLLTFQFCYLIFLFAFSLLSTGAVVFTVASLYTSKEVSFSNTFSAIPKILKRLFITFLWVSLLMFVYNSLLVIFLVLALLSLDSENAVLLFVILILIILFLVFHVYITALWHLASVVSVLEPIYGLQAMNKSYELLKGRTQMAVIMVFIYLIVCSVISATFGTVVVHGADTYGTLTRIMVGGFLVGVLVVVNFIGLLVQSVFYYVCKSYHHQAIDKGLLHEQLGGYLGEYVPLKSNIQMENLEV